MSTNKAVATKKMFAAIQERIAISDHAQGPVLAAVVSTLETMHEVQSASPLPHLSLRQLEAAPPWR